ncbi:DUF4142 domain-containing protein [Pseudonocardia kunmingensis]|uniref:Uncharacterized protein DUF4142 n=1 Tax=Pseudonocardia kunmingensis TaxID=630975 RepID=A0A543CYQ7_9PSEU|nr:DUF4142 domain-containing protein [Pseudonocardia kunmingensis]TQM02230.1 uncharacterized protein DUF4142 [Pseudonocardia kunmingensis]
MRTRPIRKIFAHAIAVTAVLGVVFGAVSGCGSPDQAEMPPASAPGAPADQQNPAGEQGGSAQQGDPLAAAGQGAAALAALGGLGQAQGVSQPVRDLGTQLATDGQAVLDRMSASAGGTLEAEPTAEQEAALADLRARTGEQFDAAWLRAAMQMQQEARDAANAVLADENASDEAKAAAQEALNRLDALEAELQQAAAPAGAGTPEAVDAGSGGQAAGADVAPMAAGLVGLGVALLAGALWWRRRA